MEEEAIKANFEGYVKKTCEFAICIKFDNNFTIVEHIVGIFDSAIAMF